MEHKLRTILNHLGNTAVYVVRRDTHELLYFNDKVREIQPDVALGKRCHEVWPEACSCCPLTEIGDKPANTVLSIGGPFGAMADLTASPMTWGDEQIPVYLISATPHERSVEEKRSAREQERLASVMARLYPLVVSIDLTRNRYTLLKNGVFDQAGPPDHGKFDDLLDVAAARSLEPRQLDACRRERLLEAFQRGQRELYREYDRRSADGSVHWMSVYVAQLDGVAGGDVRALALCRLEDGRKGEEMQLALERRAIYDSLPGGVVKCVMDGAMTLLEGSQSFFDMVAPESGFAGGCLSRVLEEDAAVVRARFREAAARGEPTGADFWVRQWDGNALWVHAEGKQVDVRGGLPVYLFVVLDISERKRMQRVLEQERVKYRMAVESAADGVFEYDPIRDVFEGYACPGFTFGGLKESGYLAGLEGSGLVHPDDVENVRGVMTGRQRQTVVRIKHERDAEYVWVLMQSDMLRNKDGIPRKVVGTLRDISAHRARELELQKQERIIRSTLDTVLQGAFDEVFTLELDRKTVRVIRHNGAYRRPFGPRRPGFQENLLDTLHPTSRPAFQASFGEENLRRAFEAGRERVYQEGLRMGSDGKYHWISVEAVRLGDGGDRTALILVSTIDARKAQEQESQLMATSVLAIFGELIIVDLESGMYRVRKGDDSTRRVLEPDTWADFVSDNRRYGMTLVHPEDRPHFFGVYNLENMRRRVGEGERRLAMELRRVDGEGNYRWCEFIGVAMENGKGDGFSVILTFRDVDELRRAQIDKRVADQRFLSAVNTSYDGIYEYDFTTGRSVMWKKSRGYLPVEARSDGWKPWDREDYLVRVGAEYRDGFQRQFCRDGVTTAFYGGESEVSAEVPYLDGDGVYRWYLVQVQLVERGPGGLRGMAYIKDVDGIRREESRKQAALRDALALAEQSNSAKSGFLSQMSHDMRTPMNAIIGMTTLAEHNLEDPERTRDCLRKIDMSARFLLTLINDVLDMSKIESGKMKISPAPFDFRALLRELEELHGGQAREKGQRLKFRAGDGVAARYEGDALRLRQVLMNLIQNAVKFTPEGGEIRVEADLERRAPECDYLRIKVTDNGIGMSEAFQGRLFEPFTQEHGGGGRVFEGSGLGLSITRNLVHLMGGQISVKSALGEGSQFVADLPLVRLEAEEPRAPGPRQEEVVFHGERVLLVEDNKLNREIAQALLEMADVSVETAGDGREAVEKFAAAPEGHYRAVLMDIRMPVMDGLEATRRIRALDRPDAGAVPIIAMTANAFQDEQQEAWRAGITTYLTKPVEAEVLYRVLYQELNGRRPDAGARERSSSDPMQTKPANKKSRGNVEKVTQEK